MRKHRQFIPDEDAPLLLAWHRGDLAAFETLIWKYQKRVFNLALLITGGQKAAGEITENSFLTAFQNIKSLKSSIRFSAWLVAIALKECRERNDYQSEEPEFSAEPEFAADDDNGYFTAMHKKLALCIRTLPFEQGELILLRYVRGYSLEKIEEILQLNGDRLLTRLFEAQETLACWLKSNTENPAELSRMKIGESSVPHAEIRRNFPAYLDSSIDGADKALTKEHLKLCGSCREALAELEWMIEDIKSLPDVEPPHWLAAAIMQRINKSSAKPAKLKGPSHVRIQIAVAALFIAFLGISSYLLLKKSEPSFEITPREKLTATPQPAPKKSDPNETYFTSRIKGVFKGTFSRPDKSPATESAPRVSAPVATELPSESAATNHNQPTVPGKSDATQKKEKADGGPSLPSEWGEPVPQSRIQQKKPPLPRARGEEITVVLNTAAPGAAGHDIESAVTSLGGKITGRAYNSGNDILYTRVEADRFFELMSRLEKIGTIEELPQFPEGAEGALELTIRW